MSSTLRGGKSCSATTLRGDQDRIQGIWPPASKELAELARVPRKLGKMARGRPGVVDHVLDEGLS